MSTSGTSVRLGVDLGTTWTAAAVARSGSATPEVLELGDHGSAMPSVVALEGSDIVAGDAAERRLLADPTAGAREPKRRLGDTTPYIIGGTPYGADALMGHLLRHVANVVATTGATPAEVVLTHPANWGEYKLDLLREAARIADVPDIVLVTEPEAAAAHYVRLGRVAAGQTVAVYDFGGGTFDVAIVRCTHEGTELLGEPEGLERLGGLDLDEAVLAHVNAALDGKLAEADPDDPAVRQGMAKLRVECTKAKEALSADSETSVPVGLPGLVTEIRVTREEFEGAVRARLNDTLTALDRAVASAGITNEDLAGVLLVGGSSRIPLVSELVSAHVGRPVLRDADAKLVVALGAAGGSRSSSAAPAAAAASVVAAGVAGAAAAVVASTLVEQTRETTMADDSKSTTAKPADPKAAIEAKAKEGAAKNAAAKGGGGGDAKSSIAKKLENKTVRRVAAGAAGVAAVAGVAAAGVTAAGAMTTDDTDSDDAADGSMSDVVTDEVDGVATEAPPDDSMDAFDDVAGPSGGGGGGGGGRGGGGGGAVRQAAPRRAASRDDDDGPSMGASSGSSSSGSAGSSGGPGSSSGGSGGSGTTMSDPSIEAARNQLRDRLEHFEAPAGADPAEVAELKAELEGLVDRFQPIPGQSDEDALAALQDQFEDKVEDFTRDQRIDALVDEQMREDQDAADLASDVGGIKTALTDKLTAWQPPEGTDAADVADLRGDLTSIIDNYVPAPGTTHEQAIAQLQQQFDTRVHDFTQDNQIDVLVGLEPTTTTAPPGDGTATTPPATGEDSDAGGKDGVFSHLGDDREELRDLAAETTTATPVQSQGGRPAPDLTQVATAEHLDAATPQGAAEATLAEPVEPQGGRPAPDRGTRPMNEYTQAETAGPSETAPSPDDGAVTAPGPDTTGTGLFDVFEQVQQVAVGPLAEDPEAGGEFAGAVQDAVMTDAGVVDGLAADNQDWDDLVGDAPQGFAIGEMDPTSGIGAGSGDSGFEMATAQVGMISDPPPDQFEPASDPNPDGDLALGISTDDLVLNAPDDLGMDDLGMDDLGMDDLGMDDLGMDAPDPIAAPVTDPGVTDSWEDSSSDFSDSVADPGPVSTPLVDDRNDVGGWTNNPDAP